MKLDELIQVGTIHKAHGIKGWLKITFSYPFLFETVPDALFIGPEKRAIPYPVEEINQTSADQYLLKLDECNDKGAADQLAGKELWLPADVAEECFDLEDDDLGFLNGFKLIDAEEHPIGEVTDVIEMPGHWMLEINYQEKEVLIPLVEDHIIHIDKEKQLLQMHITEGLLDL